MLLFLHPRMSVYMRMKKKNHVRSFPDFFLVKEQIIRLVPSYHWFCRFAQRLRFTQPCQELDGKKGNLIKINQMKAWNDESSFRDEMFYEETYLIQWFIERLQRMNSSMQVFGTRRNCVVQVFVSANKMKKQQIFIAMNSWSMRG